MNLNWAAIFIYFFFLSNVLLFILVKTKATASERSSFAFEEVVTLAGDQVIKCFSLSAPEF